MGKKKPAYNILAGLFGGFGEAANEAARIKAGAGSRTQDLYDKLAEMSLKQQFDLNDPYNKLRNDYLKARIDNIGQEMAASAATPTTPYGSETEKERAYSRKWLDIQKRTVPEKKLGDMIETDRANQAVTALTDPQHDWSQGSPVHPYDDLRKGTFKDYLTPPESMKESDKLFQNYLNQTMKIDDGEDKLTRNQEIQRMIQLAKIYEENGNPQAAAMLIKKAKELLEGTAKMPDEDIEDEVIKLD